MSISSRRILLASICGAVLVVVFGWYLARSSSASGASGAIVQQRASTTPGPDNNFGFSVAVQDKIGRLNAELDGCLTKNGASRVALGGAGWTYTDPGGRPSAACAGVQDRVNSYAESQEYRDAVADVLPAVQAYSTCLQRHGVATVTHGTLNVAERAILADAQRACGASAIDVDPAG